MPSQHTDPIAEQRAAISESERRLWAGGFNEAELEPYQAAWQALEALYAARNSDDRHAFVVVIPVADRPRHLETCLDSLQELCRLYGYGGQRDGRFAKVEVFIADDSLDEASMAAHRELAGRYDAAGLTTRYFGLEAQQSVLDVLGPEKRAALAPMLGDIRAPLTGHKGASVTRNLAFLRLSMLYAGRDKVLFHAIDSDQEFKVKVATRAGDRDVYAVSYFHALDEIFSQTDALMLTGKVVGDPPVSPAVMAGNFMDDVIAFLQRSAERGGQAPCGHHEDGARREGEAAYHDMADLFGFGPGEAAYRYRCPLSGAHDEAAGFDHFAGRLNAFFHGEHPTRVSFYQYADALGSVQPARTVYTGNYVFRPEGLKWFIPFAALRLRMAGPSLGRIVRAEVSGRFVQANLPMLHRRTVEDTAESECRPRVLADETQIDLCGEFGRQFHGDVVLFTLERLAKGHFPCRSQVAVSEAIDSVYASMLDQYAAKHAAIIDKLATLKALLDAPGNWWNQAQTPPAGLADFKRFSANIEHNFGSGTSCFARIAQNGMNGRNALVKAIHCYPDDRQAWEAALVAGRGRAA